MEEETPMPTNQSKRVRVFIAQDGTLIRSLITEVLTRAGYDVVGSGKNNLSIIRRVSSLRPDILLLDIALENTGQTIALFRRTIPVMRIIVCSAATDKSRVIQALREGACDYVAKPFRRDRLLEALRKAEGGT